MPNCHLEFLFDKKVPRELAWRLDKQHSWTITELNIIAQRAKLQYIPVMELTARLGPPRGSNHSRFLSGLDLMSDRFHKFIWRWSNSDQEAYGLLRRKAQVKVKKSDLDRTLHVYWPITIFDVKEVQRELDKVRSGKLLSPDDESDRELVGEYSEWTSYAVIYKELLEGETPEKRIRFLVEKVDEDLRFEINGTYKVLTDVYKEVNSVFWFCFFYF